ncbi:MAG: M20 family metallopeptidase [Lachnospiraceae bacterium]
MNEFLKKAIELKAVTKTDRRYLHQNAEAGRELPSTTAYIKKRLKQIGLVPEEICNSGITATIVGKYPGKTILLRGDTDALPMVESNELPFKSKTNAAHNCGHDMHTAMLLSAAQILMKKKDELKGNVKLMFQPAEEVFDGAKKMIEAGILEQPKVDVAMGIHTMLDLEAPSIGYSSGNMTSSCDGFKIVITGKGTHGATPHNGIDPINAGVHLYLAFQELIAREVPPMETVSLTFGELSAGNSCNIVPQECVLQGTLRAYNPQLRENIMKRIKEITMAMETMFRVKIEYEALSCVPATYTNPELLKDMLVYVKEIEEDMQYLPEYKVTPSDDFAFIAQRVPTVYFMLGCKVAGCNYAHHNPGVLFDEEAMIYGVALHAQCAYNWLNNQ